MADLAEVKLGDRVRIREDVPSDCMEWIGDILFVCGMTVGKSLIVNVCLSSTWPPSDGGTDGWQLEMLDKVP